MLLTGRTAKPANTVEVTEDINCQIADSKDNKGTALVMQFTSPLLIVVRVTLCIRQSTSWYLMAPALPGNACPPPPPLLPPPRVGTYFVMAAMRTS